MQYPPNNRLSEISPVLVLVHIASIQIDTPNWPLQLDTRLAQTANMDSSGSMVFKVDHFVSPIRRKKRVFYSKDLKELILKISRANLDLLERDKRYFHAKVAAQLEEQGYDIGRQALARKLREILDEPQPQNDSEYSQQFINDLQVVRDAIGKAKQGRVKDERLMYKGETVFDRPIQMHPPTQQQTPSTPIPGGQHTMSVSPQSGLKLDNSLGGTNLNDPRRPNSGKSKDKRLQYKGHVIQLDEWRTQEPPMQPQASSSMAGMVQGQGQGQMGQGSPVQGMGGQGQMVQGSPVQGMGQGTPVTPVQGYGSRPDSGGRPSPNTNTTPNPDFSSLLSDDIESDLQADLDQELNPIGLGLGNVQSVQGLIDAVGQVSQGNVNHDLLKRLVSETERLRNTMEQSLAWEKERAQQAHGQRQQLIELQKERVELVRRMAG